jgi:hypothetical protein
MAQTKRQQNNAPQGDNIEMARNVEQSTLTAGEAAVEAFRDYARERPEVVAMWAFGLGFVLGWKLRIF